MRQNLYQTEAYQNETVYQNEALPPSHSEMGCIIVLAYIILIGQFPNNFRSI